MNEDDTSKDGRNPQLQQMADESMVRNLEAQAEAIWPQEIEFFRNYGLSDDIAILDVGCGTGEISSRLARLYPASSVTGVDVLARPLELARRRHAKLSGRLDFRQGDAFNLEFGDSSFDLCVCRHMLQAVPEVPRVIRELARVARAGGRLHLLNEDYGMLHVPAGDRNTDRLWHEGVIPYTRATGTDARVGRHTYSMLRDMGFDDITVNYVTVDTLRAPRAVFAGIITAWRDGYTTALAEHTALSRDEVLALFDDVIDSIKDERQYAVWQIPIISATVEKH